MKTWFTSDNHFNHGNILEYCSRPFASIDAMNAAMEERWNARVGVGDLVYHLGDFAMGKREEIPTIRKRLHGRIVLVLGNHDRGKNFMLEAGFDEVHDKILATVDGTRLYLCHRPPWSKQGVAFGDVNAWRKSPGQPAPQFYLCGHVHQHWVRKDDIINVGVDVRNYQPVSLEELLVG